MTRVMPAGPKRVTCLHYFEPADVARALGLTTAGVERMPATVLLIAARTPRGGRLYDPEFVNQLAQPTPFATPMSVDAVGLASRVQTSRLRWATG